jgi:hypothetical protein
MTQLSQEQIDEFKEIFKKHYGKELSNEEAYESAHNLVNYFELLLDLYLTDLKRKKKLEKYPKGFHLEGEGYTCCICHTCISNKETWYNKNGIKCLPCQKALNKKIIPQSVCKDDKSWFFAYDLKSEQGLHYSTVQKMIREGKLKVKNIPSESGKGIHFQVFLVKENKEFIKGLRNKNKKNRF